MTKRYFDSQVTFVVRGTDVWRLGNVTGEQHVAQCFTPEWAREIAKAMRYQSEIGD